MAQRLLSGAPASPGVVLGPAWRRPELVVRGEVAGDREQERDIALSALAEAGRELSLIAADLPPEEAAIVHAGTLMAADPALIGAIEEAVLLEGLAAADAIVRAAGRSADAIAALGDENLAARADDVRSLGRRAARLSCDRGEDVPGAAGAILIAPDLGPADVAELAPLLAGIALVTGGVTAHAAIVARSLGVPMVTGLEPGLLELADGVPLSLDGTTGTLVVEPDAENARAAVRAMDARRLAAARAVAERDQAAVTRDGQPVMVLVNVAGPKELRVGLRAGAEGIGLLRTELAFLERTEWPEEQDHTDALKPIIAMLDGRRAVVRALDFSVDKAPPFLGDIAERGLELLLAHSHHLLRQLRAILLSVEGRDVRILMPMVDSPEQIVAVRTLLEQAGRELAISSTPPLGSMIETPLAAENADAIAAHSDFLSIGTNDLTAATLRADRFAVNEAQAHDPRVLGLIKRSVTAAENAGIPIEVCGEAASDPITLPLLLGLGVREVSVGAARVGAVRQWLRQLSAEDAARLAISALAMSTASEVERAAAPLASELRFAETANASRCTRPSDRGFPAPALARPVSRERVAEGGDLHALGG